MASRRCLRNLGLSKVTIVTLHAATATVAQVAHPCQSQNEPSIFGTNSVLVRIYAHLPRPGWWLFSSRYLQAAAPVAMGLRLPLEVSSYWKQHVLSDIDVSLELACGLDQTAATDEPEPGDQIIEECPNTSVLRKDPGTQDCTDQQPILQGSGV